MVIAARIIVPKTARMNVLQHRRLANAMMVAKRDIRLTIVEKVGRWDAISVQLNIKHCMPLSTIYLPKECHSVIVLHIALNLATTFHI